MSPQDLFLRAIDARIDEKLAQLYALTPRAMRINRGFTTEQLAEKAGVHPNTVRNIEAGQEATDETLKRLKRVMGELYVQVVCKKAV